MKLEDTKEYHKEFNISDEEFDDSIEEDINPIFDMELIDTASYTKSNIETIYMTEKSFIIVIEGNQIIRKRVDTNENYKVISIPCDTETHIAKIYSDVHGFHTIIGTMQNTYYYINLLDDNVIQLNSLSKFPITCLCFSLSASIFSSNDILFGTFDGFLFSYHFENDNKQLTESSPTKLLQIPQPIYGIAFDTYKFTPNNVPESALTLILVATNDSLYQFIGEKPFPRLFEGYKRETELNKYKKTIAKGNMVKSELKICYSCKNNEFELSSFAWKTGLGVVHGEFRDKNSSNIYPIIKKILLETYSKKGEDEAIQIPVSVGISEYFICLLYPEMLCIISKASQRIIHTKEFDSTDIMKCGKYESSTKSCWIHSNKSLSRVIFKSNKENLWRQQLDSGNYADALKYCKEYDTKYYEKVAGIYANDLMRQGKYIEAANLYSESNFRFENIVSKFMRVGAQEQLGVYLMSCIKKLGDGPEKRMQRVILCTLLVELQLDKLNKLGAQSESELPEDAIGIKKLQKQEAAELYKEAVSEFT